MSNWIFYRLWLDIVGMKGIVKVKKRGIKSCVMFYLYKCFGLKIGFK